MKALEISITAFDHNDEVDFNDYIYTSMNEADLNRSVVARLYTKATKKSINEDRFIWSVRKRMELTDVII